MCTGAEAQMAAQMAASQSGGGGQFGPAAPAPQLGGGVPSFGGGAGLGGFGGAPTPPSLEQVTGPLNSQQAEVGPQEHTVPEELAGPANQTGFGGFFGNLDQNLQSPSR